MRFSATQQRLLLVMLNKHAPEPAPKQKGLTEEKLFDLLRPTVEFRSLGFLDFRKLIREERKHGLENFHAKRGPLGGMFKGGQPESDGLQPQAIIKIQPEAPKDEGKHVPVPDNKSMVLARMLDRNASQLLFQLQGALAEGQVDDARRVVHHVMASLSMMLPQL